jgi:hypothetical protein
MIFMYDVPKGIPFIECNDMILNNFRTSPDYLLGNQAVTKLVELTI